MRREWAPHAPEDAPDHAWTASAPPTIPVETPTVLRKDFNNPQTRRNRLLTPSVPPKTGGRHERYRPRSVRQDDTHHQSLAARNRGADRAGPPCRLACPRCGPAAPARPADDRACGPP